MSQVCGQFHFVFFVLWPIPASRMYVQPVTAAWPTTQEAETQLTEGRRAAAWWRDAATTTQNPTQILKKNFINIYLQF